MTEKKDLTDDCIEFVSKLYLPLCSYSCSIVEVNETLNVVSSSHSSSSVYHGDLACRYRLNGYDFYIVYTI